ncbi:MAG: PAS domain S-box protein [Chloroflexota bacterium]|nr:PAS domain S-box protein [Chloroflexota bacterium]MDQ5866670.1 PAS domain S-box protein [Chloroflexota bacterium]
MRIQISMTPPSFVQLLQAVAEAADQATTIEEAAQICLDRVCAFMGWPVGHLYVCGRRAEDQRGELVPTTIWHIEDVQPGFDEFKQVSEELTFGAGVGLPGRVLVDGKPAWVGNVTDDPDFARAPFARKAGLRAAFASPISVGDELVGVLEFFSEQVLEPDESLLELMTNLGAMLGRVVERSRARQALLESEAKYRLLVEQASDGIAVYDRDGCILEVNSRAVEMIGYSREELLELNIMQVIAPEDLQKTPLRFEQLRSGEPVIGERVLVRPDGSRLPVELSARMLSNGNVQVIVRDITQRKLAEEQIQRLNEDLERRVAERTAELQETNRRLEEARQQAEEAVHIREELLSVVSHDLKNPLAAILGNTQMLVRRLATSSGDDNVQLLRTADRISRAANKMLNLVDELLDFGRLQAGQPLTLQLASNDLVELAAQVVEEHQQSTNMHRVSLEAEVPTLPVRSDATRLERVLSNLLSNAVKYSPEGGEIEVRVAKEQQDGREWAVLSVRDEGLGIREQDLPHIFEWFRRAQNNSGRISGAGIGLASANQIVSQHNGTIEVSSTEGQGSTFTVRLPVS